MTRLLLTFAAGALLFSSTPVFAQTIEGEVWVVLAKEAPGPIAPELAQMPALRRAPFDAFQSLALVERRALQIEENRPTEVVLPNGRVLRLEATRSAPDGRFRVRVSIKRAGEDAYLPLLQVVASPGDPFFVAGQSHEGGTLVIGVRLGRSG